MVVYNLFFCFLESDEKSKILKQNCSFKKRIVQENEPNIPEWNKGKIKVEPIDWEEAIIDGNVEEQIEIQEPILKEEFTSEWVKIEPIESAKNVILDSFHETKIKEEPSRLPTQYLRPDELVVNDDPENLQASEFMDLKEYEENINSRTQNKIKVEKYPYTRRRKHKRKPTI